MAASVGSAPVSPDTLPAPSELDVLAVIDHLAMGGAEMLLGQFAAAAPRAGIRLHVACFEHSDGSPAAEPLRALGIEPVHFDLPGRPSARQLGAMREHIRALGPDVVHTHLGGADLVGGLAARSLGVPAVCTIHQIAQRATGTRRVKNMAFELGRRFCDARVITVSDSARRAFLELHPGMEGRVVRIHNGVDVVPRPGSGREVRRELGVGEDELLVGMVSALRTEKAHDVAIEAVGLLAERFPKLRLMIAGQGRLGEELAELAAPLGERVLLAGRRTDVMAVYDALDVCLHPSRIDAFPTTLIEALAAGTPILASAVGGIPEIVQDGRSGMLIEPPPSPAKVAQALAELLEQPQRRAALAAEGRVVYERRFTAEPWVRRTRALYDEVLAEARGARPSRTEARA
jgi:glycosyltransferase involved in cell wall biosynthesis